MTCCHCRSDKAIFLIADAHFYFQFFFLHQVPFEKFRSMITVNNCRFLLSRLPVDDTWNAEQHKRYIWILVRCNSLSEYNGCIKMNLIVSTELNIICICCFYHNAETQSRFSSYGWTGAKRAHLIHLVKGYKVFRLPVGHTKSTI